MLLEIWEARKWNLRVQLHTAWLRFKKKNMCLSVIFSWFYAKKYIFIPVVCWKNLNHAIFISSKGATKTEAKVSVIAFITFPKIVYANILLLIKAKHTKNISTATWSNRKAIKCIAGNFRLKFNWCTNPKHPNVLFKI